MYRGRFYTTIICQSRSFKETTMSNNDTNDSIFMMNQAADKPTDTTGEDTAQPVLRPCTLCGGKYAHDHNLLRGPSYRIPIVLTPGTILWQ